MAEYNADKVFEDRSSSDELRALVNMEQSALDELPFGAIRLDRNGIIRGYNRFESRLAGLEPARVIGKNFFTEVAPCTNVKEFAGKFRDGMDRGDLHEVFDYVLSFTPPRKVTITLYLHKLSGNAWVLVKAGPVASSADPKSVANAPGL